ncbi:MAG: sigma-70 family RNA polymerase sigma factor [Acidobacteriota bacterium]|nr:sigma-70 family RNA polymerase sigma factor [Acidobacteriota bacterium]
MPSEPPIPAGGDTLATCRDLLNQHLGFIEAQCRRAVRRMAAAGQRLDSLQLENDSLELSNRVIDRCRENDYALIRRFDHRSRFTTYLTTVIARQAVERMRKSRGRTRARERATALGKIGLQLFEKIVPQGLAPRNAVLELLREPAIGASEQQLTQMADHILGRQRSPAAVIISMNDWDQLHASAENPEATALAKERRERIRAAISLLRGHLSGSDWLLLRLRFPADQQSPGRKASEIADLLGISRKAVYRRLDRLLPHCRRLLQKAGIEYADLIAPQAGNSRPEVRPRTGGMA